MRTQVWAALRSGSRSRPDVPRGRSAADARDRRSRLPATPFRLLLLLPILAGCAGSPRIVDDSCCGEPAPGSVRLHTGGQFYGGVGFSR
jgi:hypothetical protein